jgi:ADP-heptose:LPS heptosyltransferase
VRIEAAVNADRMRAIDYWVGIPLTFLLTIVWRVQRLIGLGGSPAGRPRHILFIQLAEMGTMVVASPALRRARERFPDATLHFLCFAEIRPGVEIVALIPSENIMTLDASSGLSLATDTLRFLRHARRRRIDTVVNMEAFVRFSSLLSYLSGASRRVGFHRFNQEGLYCGDLLTHKVLHNAHIHAAHTFLDLVHALEAPSDQVPLVKRPRSMDCLDVPKIAPDAGAAARLWEKLRAIHPDIGPDGKLVVLNPNASDRFPMRRWPLESFIELGGQLLEDPEVFVLVTGVARDRSEAREMCARLGPHRPDDDDGAAAPVPSGARAGHQRLGPGALRRADPDSAGRLLRAGGARALWTALAHRGHRPHGLLLQPVHRRAEPAPLAVQRQPLLEKRQRR